MQSHRNVLHWRFELASWRHDGTTAASRGTASKNKLRLVLTAWLKALPCEGRPRVSSDGSTALRVSVQLTTLRSSQNARLFSPTPCRRP
jgi:hypothetical protein